MSYYNNKLNLIDNSFKQLLDKNKLIAETKSNLIKSISDLKSLFASNFNQCIADLEIVINAAKENEVKQENINDNETEESPASIRPSLLWPNNSKIWIHNLSNSVKNRTFTINTILQPSFEIPVKIISGDASCMVIGVSKEELDSKKTYLGGDIDNSWGIAGNNSLGEMHIWTTGKGYKIGDVVTISGNNGIISYRINNIDNSSYQFDMGTTNLYFAVTLNNEDSLELLT